MPWYSYQCGNKECGHVFEGVYSFKDSDGMECPKCKKKAERLLDDMLPLTCMNGYLMKSSSDHGDGRFPFLFTNSSRGKRKDKSFPKFPKLPRPGDRIIVREPSGKETIVTKPNADSD